MFAGFCTKCGADDEEDGATDTQRTGGDLPVVQDDGFSCDFSFECGDFFLVFKDGIGGVGERPESIRCG